MILTLNWHQKEQASLDRSRKRRTWPRTPPPRHLVQDYKLSEWEIWPSGDSGNTESKGPVTCLTCHLGGKQPGKADCSASQEKPAIRVVLCHVPILRCWQSTLFFVQTLLPPTVWAIWDRLSGQLPLRPPVLTSGINYFLFSNYSPSKVF